MNACSSTRKLAQARQGLTFRAWLALEAVSLMLHRTLGL